MAEERQAHKDEMTAFRALGRLIRTNAQVAANGISVSTPSSWSPAGSQDRFPDFGFVIGRGPTRVDILCEYKQNKHAPMGSMRDWVFDAKKGRFAMMSVPSEEKQLLLDVINNEPEVLYNTMRLMAHFHEIEGLESTSKIFSGMLTPIRDIETRRKMVKEFESRVTTEKHVAEKTIRKTHKKDKTALEQAMELIKGNTGYNIATLSSPDLGDAIVKHYRKKYREAAVGDKSICFMVIGPATFSTSPQLYLIGSQGLQEDDWNRVSTLLGIDAKKIPTPKFDAQLEVRIQPITKTKVRIDTLASLRLTGANDGETLY